MDKLIKPKTYFYNGKTGERYDMFSEPRTAKIFVNLKAPKLLKQGSIRIRVVYGKQVSALGIMELFDNEGTYGNLSDLQWATTAFLDEELWVREIKKKKGVKKR